MAAIKMIKLSSILPPEKTNPRKIKDHRLQALKVSLQQFPKMMELRPIIIDENNRLLAGSQKFKALIELGTPEIPSTWVKKATELTPEEKHRFMLMDNEHFGEYDYEILAKDWDIDLAKDWGLEMKMPVLTEPITIHPSKQKGCRVLVTCENKEKAHALNDRLLKEGYEVKIK